MPHRQPFLWETLSVPPEVVLTASPSAPLKWPLYSSCWVDFYPFASIHPSPPTPASSLHCELWKTEFPFLCSLHQQQKWHTQQALLTPKQTDLFLLFLWPRFPGQSKRLREVLTVTQQKEHFKDTEKLSGDRTSPQQARQLWLVYNFQSVLSKAPRVRLELKPRCITWSIVPGPGPCSLFR